MNSFTMRRFLFSFACNGSKSLTSKACMVPRYCRAMSSGFSSSNLDLTFQNDGTALVTMKKEDNRFSPETIDDWHHVFDQIEKTPECRVLVTTGRDHSYCNGLDIEYMKTFTNHQRQYSEYMDKFNRLLIRMLVFPVPTVAAINGDISKGGTMWALAHDMRVMRRDRGQICLDVMLYNGRITALQMELLKAKISSAQARTQTILFGKKFTSAEALHYGIVDKMADQSQLVDISKEMANQILGEDEICRDNLNLFKKDLYQHVLVAPRMPSDANKPLNLP